MIRGPMADTLFSEWWATISHKIEQQLTPYYLMRWAYRKGFEDRGSRDRTAALANNTEGK